MPEKRNVLAFQDCVDADPEVREWQEAIASVIVFEGGARADEILGKTVDVARRQGTSVPFAANTAYINTIPPHRQPHHPGNREIENRLRSAVRWNALAMVLKANQTSTELGGHIASFQSAATLYDTGFMHFWRAPSETHGGDLVLCKVIPRPAFMPAHFWKAGSAKSSC